MWALLSLASALAVVVGLAAPPPGGARLTPEQRGLLSERLEHAGSFKVRLQAALILGAGGGDSVEPVLSDALRSDAEPQVRAAAALALADLGGTMAVAPLVEALGDDDSFVRAQADRALSTLATREGPALAAPLALALASAKAESRPPGLRILGSLGPQGAAGLVQLLDAEGEADRGVAGEALAALPTEEANRALRSGLRHGTFPERALAAHLLGERRDVAALPLLADAASDPTEVPEVQRAARAALARLSDGIDERAEEDLLKSAPAPAERVRALVLLAAKGGGGAALACEAALRDESPTVRDYAVQALGEIGALRSLPALKALLESEKDAALAGVARAAIQRIERQATPGR